MKNFRQKISTQLKTKIPIGTIFLVLLFLLGYLPGALAQTTYTVSTTGNSGAGTLRQAIIDAEANAGGDIIEFTVASGSTISISSTLPSITQDLDINGLGETLLAINGQNAHGILHIQSGTVNISDLTFTNGRRIGGNGIYGSGGGAGLGGAILMEDGDLTLTNVSLANNAVIGGNAVGFTYNTNSAGSNWFSGVGGSGTLSAGGAAGVALGGNGSNGGFGSGGGSGAKGSEDFPFSDPGNGGSGGFGAGGGAGGGFYDFGVNDTGAAGASGSFAGIAAPGVYRANNGSVDNANRGHGGSGAGLGGALFVIAGNVECYNVHFSSNGTTGGTAVSDLAGVPIPASANGQAKGGAIFLMDGVTATSRGITYSNNTAANAGSTATDNADLYGTISNITPSNINLSANTINENLALGTVIGVFNAVDGIAGYNVTLVAGTGDTDNGNFNIINNQLLSNTIFNFEVQTSRSIRIMYDGGNGDTGEQEFQISITDTPDISISASSIDENMSIGSSIGIMATTDGTTGSTFNLVSGSGDTDNGSFSIDTDGVTLLSAASFNYEVKNTYSIRVSHDGGNGIEVFQIAINNLSNEIPPITLSNDNIDENLPAGTVIATMGETIDDDGEAVTYTFPSAATTYLSLFEIVDNELKTLAPLNFESASSYTFTLTANDNVDGSSDKEVIISVNDISEDPVNLAISNIYINKKNGLDSFVATISASDPEGTTISYTIVSVDGNASNNEFIIDRNLLKSTLNLNELRTAWNITIRAEDETGATLDKTFTIVTERTEDVKIVPVVSGFPNRAPIISTAISGDAIIMGSRQFGSFSLTGAALIYRKSAQGIWALEEQLEAQPNTGFGNHVDIEQDRALIATSNISTNSLYFYHRTSGGSWDVTNVFDHPYQYLQDYDLVENRAMVGGLVNEVIVYELNATTSLWEQADIITSTDATVGGHYFGSAIKQHGDHVIIGSQSLQAAYIYSKNSTTGDWEQKAKLQASDISTVSTLFGSKVTLYGDIAFVSDYANGKNKVYRFEKNADGSWSEKQIIEVVSGNIAFGETIAFNGETLYIGANESSTNKGVVFVYKVGASGDWELATKLESEVGGPSYSYGTEIGIDGSTLIVSDNDTGETFVDGVSQVNGGAYVYGFNSSPKLAVNGGLTLDEAATGNVTTALLQVTDANHLASETTYTVTVPTNGSLQKSGTDMINGDTFTQQDIDDGLITYQHDGSETTSDSFDFAVADPTGDGILSTTFSMTVTPVNDAPILASIGNQSGDELTVIGFTASASDVDVPSDVLTYSLDATSVANGMTIDASTGAFTWTPTELQGGDHTVTVTVTDDGTGSLTDSEAITISVLSAATIVFENLNKIYGDADFILGATSNSAGSIAYSIVVGANGTSVSGTNNEDVSLGNIETVTIRATQAADGIYLASTKDITLTIAAKAIIVTADASQTKVFGAADPTFTYTVTGALETGDAFTGIISRAVGEDVGTYAITVGTLSAGANYDLTFVGTDFSISAQTITVTADAGQTKVYAAADPTFSYTITTGALETGDTFTGLLSRAAGENVANYAIAVGTLSAGTNYDLTFVGTDFGISAQAITVMADAGQTKVYGPADPTFTYTVTTGALETGDSFTGLLSRVAGEDVGTYAITVGTLSAGANYNMTYVNSSLTISKAPITATAENKTREFGEANPTLTIAYTGFKNGDTETVLDAQPTVSTTADATTAVGTAAITLAGGSDDNYSLALVNGTLTITAKSKTVPTITFVDVTKVYGEADFDLAATSNSTGVISYSITGDANGSSLSGTDNRTLNIGNAGNFKIEANVAETTNFSAVTKSIILTIDKAQLITTAENKTRKFGEINPALTIVYTGFKNGNDVSVLSTTSNAATTGTLSSDVGIYDITVSGGSADNYAFDYVSGILTIEKADQTISFTQIDDFDIVNKTTVTFETSNTSGLEVTYSLTTGSGTIDGNILTVTGSGAFKVEASHLGNINYNASSTEVSFIVTDSNKTDQTITFNPPTSIYIDQTPLILEATTDSGLAIEFEILSGGEFANISGDNMILTGVGTVEVAAKQSGNNDFNVAIVTATIAIKPLLTISGIIVDELNSAFDAGVVEAFRVEDNSVHSSTLSAGAYSFNLKDGTYYFSVVPTDQAVYYTTLYGDVIFWEDATLITVNATMSGLDIQMSARPADDLLTGNGSVTGRIIAGGNGGGRIEIGKIMDGEAIEGVSVYLVRLSDEQIMAEVISDANGDFEINGIPEGEYRLQIEVTGVAMDLGNATISVDAEGTPIELTAIVGETGIVLEEVIASLDELFTNSVNVYPNPFEHQLNFQIENDLVGQIYLQIMATDGSVLYTIAFDKKSLKYNFHLEDINVPNGMLILRMVHKDAVATFKLLKR